MNQAQIEVNINLTYVLEVIKTFNIYYIRLLIFPDANLVIHSISFVFVFFCCCCCCLLLSNPAAFNSWQFSGVVYLGWLFLIYFCNGYFELIRCKIPCLFTLAVQIHPIPFLEKENDNRGIGLWLCAVGYVNLVWMKFAYIGHGNKFSYKFNAVLSLLVWDSSHFNRPRSSQVLC